MPLLIRKIERAKWKPDEKLKVANVPSDAITGSLRTQNNTLSVWQFNYEEEEKIINEGVLALVTGPQVKDIDSFDIVLLDYNELQKKELEITREDGKTHVEDLVHAHRNISNLTYTKLGTIAEIILNELYENRVKRVVKPEIIDIIIGAIKQNRIDFKNLYEKIQTIVKKRCIQLRVDTKFLNK